jgi:hypothetical protein
MSARFSTKLFGFRVAGYDVLRVVLGLLVLVAAGFKGYQLGTGPVAESGLLTSRWFLIVVAEVELLLGLWLLAGGSPKLTWRLSVLCFVMFACVSLYEVIGGQPNCGCFGNVVVNPRATFVLDVVLVAALLRWRPVFGTDLRAAFDPAHFRPGLRVVLVWLFVAVPAGYAMANYRAAGLDSAGQVIGDGRLVVLKPETWAGKPCPLLRYIDIPDLVRGRWLVVLYRRGCATCDSVLSKCGELTRAAASDPRAPRFALVEMPPYAPDDGALKGLATTCVLSRLSDAFDWSVATPVVTLVRDGTVVGCRTGKDAEAAMEGIRPQDERPAAVDGESRWSHCALATLYMLSRLAGISHSLASLEDMFADLGHPCSMLELKCVAERVGFEVEACRGTWQSLVGHRDAGRYAILHVDGSHFIVAFPVPLHGAIRVADPSRGVREYREEEFVNAYKWTGAMLCLRSVGGRGAARMSHPSARAAFCKRAAARIGSSQASAPAEPTVPASDGDFELTVASLRRNRWGR